MGDAGMAVALPEGKKGFIPIVSSLY